MTGSFIRLLATVMVGMSALTPYLSRAQETEPAILPSAVGGESVTPVPTADPPPATSVWTYERQMQNQAGTVTNTHRHLNAPEQGQYVRQHVVTNPRGEMTQTWERTNNDEGYLYRRSQIRTGADGAPLRQHELMVAGTDPRNYTREHTITLPDGRTMQQTQIRAWDGTNGTMERSFVGPNGQTKTSQHNWAPGGMNGQNLQFQTGASGVTAAAPPMARPSTAEPARKVRWWNKLNPFRSGGSEMAQSGAVSPPRRGFTIGTSGANATRSAASGNVAEGSVASGNALSGKVERRSIQASIQASQNTHRPSWAGGPPRSVRSQSSAAHSQRTQTASRPKPGRGRNR